MKKLMADVELGDTIVLRDEVYGPSYVLVRRIEWANYSELVSINGEIMFAKDDRVEIAE